MVPVWAVAARRVRREVSRAGVPALGIGAAFSFLIMMFNVPLPGGTTGHAVGGALLAITLGPWSACISVSIALLVQALMFGDGGILALGANSFNMALIIPFFGFFIYKGLRGVLTGPKGEYVAVAAGSYAGIAAAAFAAATELGLQPVLFRSATGMPLYFPYPLSVSVPAMVLPHLAVAGVAEAVLTVAVVTFLRRVSPRMVSVEPRRRFRGFHGVLAVLICLSPVGLLASGAAWGEWRVEVLGRMLGFVPEGLKDGFRFTALFPAYSVSGAPGILGYIISAATGAAVIVIAFKLISLARRGRRAGAGG